MSALRMTLLTRVMARRSIGTTQCRYSSKAVLTTPAMTTPSSSISAPDAERLSGVPMEVATERTVRIYSPAKTAMQSGVNNTRQWKLDFDILPEGARWENPLMGWASSGDAVQSLEMQFDTKEDAIYFAEKQGWSYYVQEPKVREFKPQVYADNYKYKPGKLRNIHTK